MDAPEPLLWAARAGSSWAVVSRLAGNPCRSSALPGVAWPVLAGYSHRQIGDEGRIEAKDHQAAMLAVGNNASGGLGK